MPYFNEIYCTDCGTKLSQVLCECFESYDYLSSGCVIFHNGKTYFYFYRNMLRDPYCVHDDRHPSTHLLTMELEAKGIKIEDLTQIGLSLMYNPESKKLRFILSDEVSQYKDFEHIKQTLTEEKVRAENGSWIYKTSIECPHCQNKFSTYQVGTT